ncbi:hypothetical protein Taro_023393 [Colocasia esculenta]|uniref:RanBP2-type domain-containing protein n=1 Tax=Colocasia esculenta TaxID=4460 RepID=A0A843VEB9_COLES|nr:hypothetical protein [Colocasia esculenta]
MRPRGREQETSPPPSSASPPRHPKGSLSSMVVLPDTATDGGGNSEIENGGARSPERRHDDVPSELQRSRSQRFSEDSAFRFVWFGHEYLFAAWIWISEFPSEWMLCWEKSGSDIAQDLQVDERTAERCFSGYGTRAGSLSSSPQQKTKYHRYHPDAEESGEPRRRRSPYLRKPEKNHYDPDFDQSVQHDRRSREPRRTPDHNRYDQDYDQVGRPHGHGSPPRRRFDHHHYDPHFDRLPEHAGDSPFQRRLDHRHYDYEYDQAGPQREREFWGERGDGRFRDISPTYGRGRGGRKFRGVSPPYGRGRGGGRFRDVSPAPYGRGRGGGRFRDVSPPFGRPGNERLYDRDFEEHGPGDMHLGGVHRNDPNLAPRVGDWICKNPSCGNLNFARREYCNKCNKLRYDYVDEVPGASPRRSYSGPPSPRGPPPRFSGPPPDRGPRRDANSDRSPPRGWARDGPPPPRNGGKFQGPGLQRGKSDYYEVVGLRGRDRFDRTGVAGRERYEFVDERRGYEQRPPSPRNRWENVPRERSRSPPPRARPSPRKDFARNSYMGRGRGDRYRAWQE